TGSCFERDLPHLQELIDESQGSQTDPFPREMVDKIAEYVGMHPHPFGAAEWKQYFQVDVGPEPEFKNGFEAWWNGPDPIDPSKFVYETHLPPILAPQFLSNEQGTLPRSLATLEKMGLKFYGEHHRSFRPIKNHVVAEPSHWLVMRKDVLARRGNGQRNRSWEKQVQYMKDLNEKKAAGYETEPSMIDLATVIFAHYAWTGEKYLGDWKGMEGRTTLSYCREYIRAFHMYEIRIPFAFGGVDNCINGKISVFVTYGRDNSSVTGIAAVRKF
ncbi:MAG TPA: hypothetical protein VLE95_01885, partial [Chlamydiales bacterium]|nr:hypothetical protein [Chlamydiales bacterium]